MIERHSGRESETVKGERGNCEPLTASLNTSSEGLFSFPRLLSNFAAQFGIDLFEVFSLEFSISKCILHCARSAGIAVNPPWLTGR